MKLTTLHKDEPVVLIGLLASLVVLVAGHLGLVLDHATVQTVLEPLITAVLARPFVTPAVKKIVGEAEAVAEKESK